MSFRTLRATGPNATGRGRDDETKHGDHEHGAASPRTSHRVSPIRDGDPEVSIARHGRGLPLFTDTNLSFPRVAVSRNPVHGAPPLPTLALAREWLLPSKPGHDLIAAIVERQGHRHRGHREQDHGAPMDPLRARPAAPTGTRSGVKGIHLRVSAATEEAETGAHREVWSRAGGRREDGGVEGEAVRDEVDQADVHTELVAPATLSAGEEEYLAPERKLVEHGP
jgi:hypothetical protein